MQPVSPASDVLLVIGYPLLVRNVVVGGLIDRLLAQGLSVSVVAPAETLPSLRRFSSGLRPLDCYPMESAGAGPLRRRVLGWLRLGSFVGRRAHPEYRTKLAWCRRGALSGRIVLAMWLLIARLADPERLAGSLVRKLRASRRARDMIEAINPALVVWLTTISDAVDFEIVQAAAERAIPIVACEGSWDNLVTKGAIWPRPQRLLVWGEYSRRCAVEYHEFRDDEVVVTGPPHFDVYADAQALTPKRAWCAAHGLDPDQHVILIGGSTVDLPLEASLLRLLSGWIDSGALPPAVVWYRPHPRAKARLRRTRAAGLPHVVLDGGLAQQDVGGGWQIDPQEARQRADALAACSVVLSSFSTIVLEGALLGKPGILVAFSPDEPRSRQHVRSYLAFNHVRYLSQTPGIARASSPEELQVRLRRVLERQDISAGAAARRFALTIAHCGDGLAGDRLVRAMQAMGRPRAMTACETIRR